MGDGAVADRANQVALGNSASTYTLAGVASTASNAAQSGSLHLLTSDAAGHIGNTALDIAELGGLGHRVALPEPQSAAPDARPTVLDRPPRQAKGGTPAARAQGRG